MRIIEINSNDINLSENKDVNLVLGYFDGVHVGHQKMIEEALKRGDVGIMTFDISPSFISSYDNACVFCPFRDICYVTKEDKRLISTEEEEEDA